MWTLWLRTSSKSWRSCSVDAQNACDTFTFIIFSACSVQLLWQGISPLAASSVSCRCVTCASRGHGSMSGSQAISA